MDHSFYTLFRNKLPLSPERWQEYEKHFHREEVPARTLILRSGEISKKFFFIERGCVRGWFNNNGMELTAQFFFEHDSVSSIESFWKGEPLPLNIETIEASEIRYIRREHLLRIVDECLEDREWRHQFIDTLLNRTFTYIHHFASFIRDSPQQRYLDLLETRPEIVQRVPQHYIASYLGISKVHLSRIKAKIARGQ